MQRRLQLALAAAVALTLLAVLGFGVSSVPAWKQQAPEGNSAQANDLTRMTDALFGPQVIAFEALGVLLTAVLIGALVIARPLTVTGTEETSLVHPNIAAQAIPEIPAIPVSSGAGDAQTGISGMTGNPPGHTEAQP